DGTRGVPGGLGTPMDFFDGSSCGKMIVLLGINEVVASSKEVGKLLLIGSLRVFSTFRFKNFAYTLQGVLCLFYSPLFNVIEAKFDFLDVKQYSTHARFYDICVVSIALVVIGFAALAYIFLLEEEDGRDEYSDNLFCQLISGATFVAVLVVPLTLMFIIYLPRNMLFVGYWSLIEIAAFVLLVTLFGYFHDWFFPAPPAPGTGPALGPPPGAPPTNDKIEIATVTYSPKMIESLASSSFTLSRRPINKPAATATITSSSKRVSTKLAIVEKEPILAVETEQSKVHQERLKYHGNECLENFCSSRLCEGQLCADAAT
nr:hypothetical protein [Tanacetum cinerariifolium]